MTSKERVLGLLNGEKIDRTPCFSGMGNVTVEGMKKHNIRFADVHKSAEDMAALAASTYKLFGFECAVVPFDLCIEAEALGSEINYYEHVEENILYPTIKTKLVKVGEQIEIPADLEERGRIPMLCEVIRLLKEDIGDEVAIGSYVLGPFTLAGQVMDLNELLKMSFKKPEEINRILDDLATVIVRVAGALKKAGADYLTIREMGAPSDVISPGMFKSLVQPHLIKVISEIESPSILHICGDTNHIVELMNECGADAISVEQKNDVAETRQKLGDEAILLGNIDPYNVLVQGSEKDIEDAVKNAIENGVNGVMPGCDIWPDVPVENMIALVEATKKYGKI
jgi:[methyl-Co(III) methanol-specific corrinoid protein]:coenzyme M methyltransferase